RVMIITNPSSSVTAIVSNPKALGEGVVDGKLHGRLVMTDIPQAVKVRPHADVYTSGLGGNFPRGIKIGQVAAVQGSDVQLFQQAEVAAYCDFARLTAVEVITNNAPGS
ncbi:MAG: rod shape-determining protein MreC, partial [Chloroflexota bacterium]